MNDGTDTDKGSSTKSTHPRRLVLGRPKWTNLALVASLIVFWAGVILKLLS